MEPAVTPSPCKALIVNADDLGLCAGVNRGIIHCHRHGLVTSTTLMVNMPGFVDALARIRDNPGLAVGLHLNLTYGRPVAHHVSSLTEGNGAFVRSPRFVWKNGKNSEIRAEFAAQAERFLAAGLRPSHLDTHHHLHESERFLDILADLAYTLGVPIRCLDEQAAAARGLTPLARFVRFFGDENGSEKLLSIIADLQPGATEIPCHPGFVDEELRALSTLNEIRQREVAALTDPRVGAAVAGHRVVLTNYRALSQGKEL